MAETYVRREKGTPAQNMLHVLHMGLWAFLAVVLLFPGLERVVERTFMPSNPISVNMQLDLNEQGRVIIKYQAHASWAVNAIWIGQLRDANDAPIYTKRATDRHGYGAQLSKSDEWTWRGWWEDYNVGAAPDPAVPQIPFKLCVRYDGRGAIGDTYFDQPYACTDVFDAHLQEAS